MKDTLTYHLLINHHLRPFFLKRGYIEVPAQTRRSILAACEDPHTISKYKFGGVVFPLPQTGQMWLESELLEHSQWQGVFCITTSYRDEPKPVDGRHDRIFPMFEFESKGDINALTSLESDLLKGLGFSNQHSIVYEKACETLETTEIGYDEEVKLCKMFNTDSVFLSNFPQRTHPFWNMKCNNDGTYAKVDVILGGMETIGSAERSCDRDQMLESFHTISDGEYAHLLYKQFGRKRVDAELQAYLAHEMFPRFGGGIGLTRLANAVRKENL